MQPSIDASRNIPCPENPNVTEELNLIETGKFVTESDNKSDLSEDILKAIEEEKDDVVSKETLSAHGQNPVVTEQSTLFSNGVWGNSVLSCPHDIPVDNFVDRTQEASNGPQRMTEIKEDASLA